MLCCMRIYTLHSTELVVASPVIEVEVARSIPAGSVAWILTETLQAQCPVHTATKAKKRHYLSTKNSNNQITKTTPPQQ